LQLVTTSLNTGVEKKVFENEKKLFIVFWFNDITVSFESKKEAPASQECPIAVTAHS